MRRSRRVAPAGVVLGAVLAAGACGSGDSSPEETVEQFTRAAAEQDYEQVCALMDPAFVEAAEGSGDGSCEDAMRETAEADESGRLIEDVDRLEIGEATVSEDEQTASVPTTYDGNETQIRLVKVDGAWRVTLDTP